MKPLPFYFDFASPYSYLAWNYLQRHKDRLESFGLMLSPRPLVMGSLISKFVDKGPAQIPPKRDFLFKQALRMARIHGIEINVPHNLFFNSLMALRLSLKEVSGKDQNCVIDELFKMIWHHGGSADDADEIVAVLSQKFPNSEVETWFEAISSPNARSALKNNLTQALEHGCFGVPSLIWEGQLFWGLESLDFLFAELRGQTTYSHEIMDKFLSQVSLR